MISTALEVAGFACAIVCAALAGGAVWAFGVACPCLLFLGFAAEGASLPRPRWPARLTRRTKD